ncbi:hypothetical protein BDW22DRAFT_1355897 [Trametopsis cervina]|nr:hypothetical protein BDW22DRAFT_1355897 [Trametopsis cervina]
MEKAVRNGQARGGKAAREETRIAHDADENIKAERERLIHERQDTVEEVLDRHDSLVRELFHLEKFVSLLSYNPEEAKKDVSPVFVSYKARHDLVDRSTGAGPSRTTRRAHTERLQSLKASPAIVSSPVSSAKAKPTAHRHPSDATLWSLIAEAKGKGKASTAVSAPGGLGHGRRGRPPKAQNKQPVKEPASSDQAVSEDAPSISAPIRRRHTTMGPPQDVPPAKRRKLEAQANGHSTIRSPSTSELRATPNKRTRSTVLSQKQYEDEPRNPTSTGSQTPVRRLKFIVRKPPPSYSSPRQRPPLPQFESSLSSFLSSYKAPEGRDLDGDELAQAVREDMRIWRQVDEMRRQGRMLHRPPESSSLPNDNKGPPRGPDIWDHIITAVETRTKTRRPNPKQMAAQVASRVKVYWEAQAVRDDKAKALEEKRLRVLAKSTIRLVTTKWKEAVYHIRDQERKKREEEERRRGHEHLDAILDQSGQLLEAQQVDLTRGDVGASRSRSTSLSATLGHWASASPVPESTGDQSDSDAVAENGEGDGDGDGGEPDADDVGSSQLLTAPDIASTEDIREHDNRDGPDKIQTSLRPPQHEEHSSILLHGVSSLDSDDVQQLPRRSFTNHRYSNLSHYDSFADVEGGITVRFASPKREWDLDRVSALPPPPHIPDHPQSSSGRSSPVSESAPDLHRDQHDELLDGTADIPPDTPTSVAFDVMSIHPSHDGEESNPAALSDADFVPTPGDDTPDLDDNVDSEEEIEEDTTIPAYLRPFAVAPVTWNPESKIKVPPLLRGTLRPYQQAGLEWLASLHMNHLNGILADEMGLGKTIQTISLLAHLACDRGIWGPHLIIVPTSVLLNWEMEFKKFLPGFKVLSYHGNTKRRKELRQGWNNKYHFNVCVTSYTLASRDAHVFKRKAWYYMILDEAHMIKNFKSQRWNILLMFRSFRRLLLTGTPLQNNLTELWALLQFLMSGTNFANLKEFGEWFSNPLEKAIEMGAALDDDNMQRVTKLHTVLRPYLLRRLKRDVEKELPSKFEHLVMCPLSKRQRFLYDEFMARADTRHDLQSGVYHRIANILMQLRKVVNHPDLFEVRPITTSFAMSRSAIADFEIQELLVRRKLLRSDDDERLNLGFLGLRFMDGLNTSVVAASERYRLDGTSHLPLIVELPDQPPKDTRTIDGYLRWKAYLEHAEEASRWKHISYVNSHRCRRFPVLSSEVITTMQQFYTALAPLSTLDDRRNSLDTVHLVHAAVKSYADRTETMSSVLDRFAFVTPAVVSLDMPNIALAGHIHPIREHAVKHPDFDALLHRISVKLQIAFPDPSLLQYDCGKLQELARLLRERKAGGHRILIFTQMTRVLDILETFLNYHGHLYLRLDGATKIEDRQYITERFNTDPRIFCFISSSRSGGVGINLTGADTVIFYDSDFNPQMDRQCEDRAHRIGQIRDVHIYRFISQHTVEEALLRKANQKRNLDDIVIQKGEFDWRVLFRDEGALTNALGDVEDTEDAVAAAVAAREAIDLEGADAADFAWEGSGSGSRTDPIVREASLECDDNRFAEADGEAKLKDEERDPDLENDIDLDVEGYDDQEEEEEEEEGGTTDDYMLAFVRSDMEFFSEWRLPGFKD